MVPMKIPALLLVVALWLSLSSGDVVGDNEADLCSAEKSQFKLGPSSSTEEQLLKVPEIDIGPVIFPDSHTPEELERTVVSISRACKNWGFFQALNHGIPQDLIERVQAKGREMFALPREEKVVFKRTEDNARGWFDDELTKQTLDWKQGFDIGHVPHPDLDPSHPANVVAEGFNQWPNNVKDFKETMDAFYAKSTEVSAQLMWGIALGLDLALTTPDTIAEYGPSHQEGGFTEPGAKACAEAKATTEGARNGLGKRMQDVLAEAFLEHTSYLRLNYYQPCPEPCNHLAVHRHTDSGALTVLLQEVGVTALQVYSTQMGQWIPISPVEGAVTINVGDMLQVWTNDLYQAPEHRVISFTDRDRFSAPFFYNPSYSTDVSPLPQLLGGTKGSRPTRPEIATPVEDTEVVATEGDEAGGDGIDCDLELIQKGCEGMYNVNSSGVGATMGQFSDVGEGGGVDVPPGAHYRTLNWGKFRLRRFEGDFADHGTEVQIADFRVGGAVA
ncbi:unnamed protein product [Choristocarpus tenellus]